MNYVEPAVILFGGLAIASTIGCIVLLIQNYRMKKEYEREEHK